MDARTITLQGNTIDGCSDNHLTREYDGWMFGQSPVSNSEVRETYQLDLKLLNDNTNFIPLLRSMGHRRPGLRVLREGRTDQLDRVVTKEDGRSWTRRSGERTPCPTTRRTYAGFSENRWFGFLTKQKNFSTICKVFIHCCLFHISSLKEHQD